MYSFHNNIYHKEKLRIKENDLFEIFDEKLEELLTLDYDHKIKNDCRIYKTFEKMLN